jgi:hypothetical protein
MTPEEAANDIVESMGMEKGGMPHLLALKIKKAIIAAIAEERNASATPPQREIRIDKENVNKYE